jgi:CheY-like chemotaxis protein
MTLCVKCSDSGVIDTGNNDLPCECPAGDTAVFYEACVGSVTGAEIRKHYYNGSPEPLDRVPNRGHALVVDDDEMTREYIVSILRAGGFEITQASNGIEGLARYHERERGYFNIIVSDWSMPRLKGTNMAWHIRRQDKNQKILLVTGDSETVRRDLDSRDLTDVKVLPKGVFEQDDLIREVLHIVGGRECEFAR